MTNIYSPQEEDNKDALWSMLTDFMSNNKGHYILFGDFNSVRSANERFGSQFFPSNAASFNDFITSNNLVDVPMGGYRYTRVDKLCSKGSRLDRFLVSDSVWNSFGSMSALVLDRNSSDHHPILLRRFMAEYGPIPFKIFHSWSRLRDSMI